ncbi:MAG: methyltransferase domain-containing protein [Acidobacteriota bacterium]|nr:methyltransferase domain-containing protein [Acidobacteriota bacterium]
MRIVKVIKFVLLAALAISFVAESNVFGQVKKRSINRRKQTAAAKLGAKRKKPRKRTFIEVASIPTPMETVAEMLRLANLKKGDVLYDLGSGDGRIVFEAARKYGVRAIGVEIKPHLVEEANRRAKAEGLDKSARFVHADLFRLNLREATVVTLYLSDSLNERLLPKLLRELRPGSRIVSHDFRMGDWQPEQSVRVPWKNLYRTVHLWTVPEKSSRKNNGK